LTRGAIHNSGVVARIATAFRTDKCLFVIIPPASYVRYVRTVKVQPQCQAAWKKRNALKIQEVEGRRQVPKRWHRRKFDTSGGKLSYIQDPRNIYVDTHELTAQFDRQRLRFSIAFYCVSIACVQCGRLLRAKRGHRNWNIERGACDTHAAFTGRGRECAARALALATGSPEHKAEHAVGGTGAVGRNRFNKIGGGFLIRSAESRAIRMSGDQP